MERTHSALLLAFQIKLVCKKYPGDGEQGKSRSSRLQWKHHPGTAFCFCCQTMALILGKVSILACLHPSQVWGDLLREGCSVGHIPSCCSTQPCCSHGFLCGWRGREQGPGCGNGVEQHNLGHAGSFLNAFIDCSVHVRM